MLRRGPNTGLILRSIAKRCVSKDGPSQSLGPSFETAAQERGLLRMRSVSGRRRSSSRLQHRIDQGRLAGLHSCDGAPQRARNILRLHNRTFGVPTAGLRELGEIRLRGGDVLADMGTLARRAAIPGHVTLMLPVLDLGADT